MGHYLFKNIVWQKLRHSNTFCLRKGMKGLRAPHALQDAGTRNPSIPSLWHKVQGGPLPFKDIELKNVAPQLSIKAQFMIGCRQKVVQNHMDHPTKGSAQPHGPPSE